MGLHEAALFPAPPRARHQPTSIDEQLLSIERVNSSAYEMLTSGGEHLITRGVVAVEDQAVAGYGAHCDLRHAVSYAISQRSTSPLAHVNGTVDVTSPVVA